MIQHSFSAAVPLKKLNSDMKREIERRFQRALLIVLVAVFGSTEIQAQSLEGDDDFNKGARTSLQFLKIGIGARQAALGEASIAMVRDVNSVFWNPANIAGIENVEAGFNYIRWLADLNYVAGSIGYRMGTFGIVSGYVASLDYGDIPEALVTGQGGANDTRTGNMFSGGDLMIGITFAREFTDRLSIGVSGKYLRESLFDYSGSTFAWDVGTNYNLGYKGIRLAMAAQNFGGSVNFLEEGSQTEGFDVPITFRLGVSMNVVSPEGNSLIAMGPGHEVRFGIEAINTNDFNERFHIGGEYSFHEWVMLRAGYRLNYEEGNLALGFGLAPRFSGMEVRVDYAYVGYEFLEAPHRFTMTLAF